MKRQRAIAIALALGLLACLVLLGTAAANGSTAVIEWWVLGSGGGPSSGGSVTLHGSMGEPVIGPSSGGNVSLHAGYSYEHGADLPQLAIAKDVEPSTAAPGRTITFTIVISNTGAVDATGAVVSDTLPTELTFAGPVSLDPPGAGTVGTPPILVTDATIPASGTILVTFPASINTGLPAGTGITNTAAVNCSEAPMPVEDGVSISVDNAVPGLGAVDPSSGGGMVEETTFFTTTWVDANGWQDLKQCYFHIGATPSLLNNVTLMYNARKEKLWMLEDDGKTWTGGYAPGSANVMQNSQAIVYCYLTTMDASGNTLAVSWAIEFKPGYTGLKKLGLKAKDVHKAKAKGKWVGTWTIAP